MSKSSVPYGLIALDVGGAHVGDGLGADVLTVGPLSVDCVVDDKRWAVLRLLRRRDLRVRGQDLPI